MNAKLWKIKGILNTQSLEAKVHKGTCHKDNQKKTIVLNHYKPKPAKVRKP